MKATRRLILSVVLSWITPFPWVVTARKEEPSPEDLFAQAVQEWRSPRGYEYQPWIDLSVKILERFKQAKAVKSVASAAASQTPAPAPRLELIGAVEESILIIEGETRHEGSNRPRDKALSELYKVYGYTLLQLSAEECYLLAMDPHTLLIGAETVKSKPQSPPSTFICIENAENTLRNAVTLDATNKEAQVLLDTILEDGNGVHTRKPKEFVAELFDSFADSFDEKLVRDLNYQVPKLIGQVIKSFAEANINNKKRFQHALDAGSGTGLAGRYMRPLVSGLLVGVDASQKMLDVAAKCTLTVGCGSDNKESAVETDDKNSNDETPLYDGLLAMDLEDMTVGNTLLPYLTAASSSQRIATKSSGNGFDLVVAADVLVYFGALDDILRTFQKVSVPGALLVFSCERTTFEEAPLGYRLLPSGRFAHCRQHVEEAANKVGFQLLTYQEIIPRQERGEDVLGHLFVFQLPDGKIRASGEEL
jgi:predicted TPR repeat methyltransferase